MSEEEFDESFAGVARRADNADFHKVKSEECRMMNVAETVLKTKKPPR
jgi:hypothetical protein